MAGSTWTKTVAIWLELCLPFRFQGHFGEGLLTPFNHGRNAQRALLCLSWFRYPDSPYWLRGLLFPAHRVDFGCHGKTFLGLHGFDPVYACGFLALVLLSHPTYCY